jgi:hypothetical protein
LGSGGEGCPDVAADASAATKRMAPRGQPERDIIAD